MNVLIQIVLLVAGLFLLWLTYKMYKKEWKAPTWICALLGMIAILSTQDWMRGFFQTGILTLGYEYGERLNSFQNTVSDIESTLRSHQSAIDTQQMILGSNQSSLASAQTNIQTVANTARQQQIDLKEQQDMLQEQGKQLENTATNLSQALVTLKEQQMRLGDVEVLVSNLFDRSRVESISGADTQRVAYATRGSNALWAVFLLRDVPVNNSIQGYFDNNPLKPGIPSYKNAAWVILVGNTNVWKGKEFSFSYVRDPRETNTISNIEIRDGVAYVDNIPLPLPKE